MIERIKREPALVMGLLRALVVLGTAFGLSLSPEQAAAIYLAAEAALTLWTRALVTPAQKPPQDPSSGSGGGDDPVRIHLPSSPPSGGNTAAMSRVRGFVQALAVAAGIALIPGLLSGCALLNDAKPVLRTVDDVASNLCALHFSEQQGLSIEDAGRKFCDTKRKLQPWIDEVLAAQQSAGARAAAQQ
jgi:hypothetical protein